MKLARQQIDRPVATPRSSIDEIKLQRSYAQHRLTPLGWRPNRGLDARICFSYREWSSRLIVASQGCLGHPVNNLLYCAQQQRMNDAFQAAKIGWKRGCSLCFSPQSSWARRDRNIVHCILLIAFALTRLMATEPKSCAATLLGS